MLAHPDFVAQPTPTPLGRWLSGATVLDDGALLVYDEATAGRLRRLRATVAVLLIGCVGVTVLLASAGRPAFALLWVLCSPFVVAAGLFGLDRFAHPHGPIDTAMPLWSEPEMPKR
jgi:hypothetical protein